MSYNTIEHMDDAEFIPLFFPDIAKHNYHDVMDTNRAIYFIRAAAYATFRLNKYCHLENHNTTGSTHDPIKESLDVHYDENDIDRLIANFDNSLTEITDEYAHKLIENGLMENAAYISMKSHLIQINEALKEKNHRLEYFKYSVLTGAITSIITTFLILLVIILL